VDYESGGEAVITSAEMFELSNQASGVIRKLGDKIQQLETDLTAAQADIKRRDEVIEELFVIFKCAGYWRNWVAAKLKEVPNDRA
jgi:hypothetical protein